MSVTSYSNIAPFIPFQDSIDKLAHTALFVQRDHIWGCFVSGGFSYLRKLKFQHTFILHSNNTLMPHEEATSSSSLAPFDNSQPCSI